VLEDEEKIDHVFKETKETRQLMGNIANRVFEYNWAEKKHIADTIAIGEKVSTT
jgi:hypothetical protein